MAITRIVGKNADFKIVIGGAGTVGASTNAAAVAVLFAAATSASGWGSSTGTAGNSPTGGSGSNGIIALSVEPIGNNITLNMEVSNEEGTGYGSDWKEYDLIHGAHSIDATFFLTNSSSSPDLEAALINSMFWGASGGPVKLGYIFGPNGLSGQASPTAPSYRGLIVPTVNISAPVGGIITVSLRGQGDGQLYRVTG